MRGTRTKLLAAVVLVAGCDGSDAPQTLPPPATAVPSAPWPDWPYGHFRGTAALGDQEATHFVEGLLAPDGEVRLHLGGPGLANNVLSGAGILVTELPLEELQFVGRITWSKDAGTGTGVVVGAGCPRPASGRWCGVAAAAAITLSRLESGLEGEIRVDTAGHGTERWRIGIGSWSLYRGPTGSWPGLIISERFAPFARSEAVVITLDGAGRLFFQSPASGCIGNGAIAARDSRFALVDVVLVIESCSATYADFNGRFDGLATVTQGSYWDYDSWLVMLLSTPVGGASRASLMTLGGAF